MISKILLDMSYKKVHTIADILKDPRIKRVIKNYDGYGKHLVECKEGFIFESFGSTIEIGTIKDICNYINNYLFTEKYYNDLFN